MLFDEVSHNVIMGTYDVSYSVHVDLLLNYNVKDGYGRQVGSHTLNIIQFIEEAISTLNVLVAVALILHGSVI